MRAGSLYFVLVFSTGFLLGTLRTLVVAPLLGARRAELLELPLMLAVSVVAARWVVRRLAVAERAAPRIVMGAVGLLLMLAAEFGLVLWLRGVSLAEYFAERDPVASTAYYSALGIFAAMPLIMLLKRRKRGL
jgi:hypothetical protein